VALLFFLPLFIILHSFVLILSVSGPIPSYSQAYVPPAHVQPYAIIPQYPQYAPQAQYGAQPQYGFPQQQQQQQAQQPYMMQAQARQPVRWICDGFLLSFSILLIELVVVLMTFHCTYL
jgi:hypothetical protein